MAELVRSNSAGRSQQITSDESKAVERFLTAEMESVLQLTWEIDGLDWHFVVEEGWEHINGSTSSTISGQDSTESETVSTGIDSLFANRISSLKNDLTALQGTIETLKGKGTGSKLKLGDLEIVIKSEVTESGLRPMEMNFGLNRNLGDGVQYRMIRTGSNGDRNAQESSLLALPLGCKSAMSQYDSNRSKVTSLVNQLPTQSQAFRHWRSFGYEVNSIEILASMVPEDTFLVGNANTNCLVWLLAENNPSGIAVIRKISNEFAVKILSELQRKKKG